MLYYVSVETISQIIFILRSKDFKSNYHQSGFRLRQPLIDTRQPRCRPLYIIHWKSHLLTDVAEAPVFSDALIRLPKHWVKGLVAVPECRRGVTRDSKGSNVNLEETKSERSASVLQMLECAPRCIRVAANTSVNVKVSYHPLVWVRCVVGGIQQFAVLQFFTQPLQQVHRFVEGSRHGHSSQIFA